MQRYRIQGHADNCGDLIVDMSARNIQDLQIKLRDMFSYPVEWVYFICLGEIVHCDWKL